MLGSAHGTLPTELLAELEASVAAGDHASLDAAILSALDEVFYQQLVDRAGEDRLRQLLQEGADSGPGLDAEAVFDRLLAKYSAMDKPGDR